MREKDNVCGERERPKRKNEMENSMREIEKERRIKYGRERKRQKRKYVREGERQKEEVC